MSQLAKNKKEEKRSVDRPEQASKRDEENLSWKEIARPMPCYVVMLVSSLFQAILAVLLLPYSLLNKTGSR